MVSHELSSKIRERVSTLLFPYNTFLTGIKTEWPVDAPSSLVSSITCCHWWVCTELKMPLRCQFPHCHLISLPYIKFFC